VGSGELRPEPRGLPVKPVFEGGGASIIFNALGLSTARPVLGRTQGDEVDDSVAVDAKRILLRYGAPISVLDKVPEKDRIALAREIAKTSLAERERHLKRLLKERGYLTES